MVRAALVAATLAAAAPGAAGDRFDLLCAGLNTTYLAGQMKVAPYSAHFRINLKTGQWCEDDCGTVRPIADVQESYLELLPPDDSDTPEGRKRYSFTIDRATGEETVLYQADGPNFYSDVTKATCKASSFSGFPVFRKRF